MSYKRPAKKSVLLIKICRIIFIAAIFFLTAFVVFKFFGGGLWDGKRRFTVVLNSNPLILFSLEPKIKQATLVTIPGNTLLDVPYGYGSYLAASVYNLGKLDLKRGGGTLLSKSIENTFGVFVDSYLIPKRDVIDLPSDISKISAYKSKYFSYPGLVLSIISLREFLLNLETNLKLIDLYKLWSSVAKIRIDRITFVNLADHFILNDDKLPDGTTIKIVDKELADRLFQAKFYDAEVRGENITVEVVNAANKEKIASQFTRILNNLGANVVVKSSSENTESFNCKIYSSFKRIKESILVKNLKRMYNCRDEENNTSGQADIKIVLGEELVR